MPMMQTADAGDVLELNVGGEIITTKRGTLLSTPDGSFLHTMFSGRWDHSSERDSHGRLFLDFTPKLFAKVISFLRTLRIAPPEAHLKRPVVAEEDKQEFHIMVSYLGLEEVIFGGNGAASTEAVLKTLQSEQQTWRSAPPTVTVSEASVSLAASTGMAHVASSRPLPQGTSTWKVTMRRLPPEGHCGRGVGMMAKPPAPGRATMFMWGRDREVFRNGLVTDQCDGWSGWHSGDTAILQHDTAEGKLKMRHLRLDRTFEIPVLTCSEPGPWHIVVMLAPNDHVEISKATSYEASLVG